MDQHPEGGSSNEIQALIDELVDVPQATLSERDIAERVGLRVEQIAEVALATGLEPVDPDVPMYLERDIAAFEVLGVASSLFSWSESIAFVRVLGSSMSRITDAANSLFIDNVERPMVAAGAQPIDVAERALEARGLADQLMAVVAMMMRRHLEQSVERHRRAFAAGASGALAPMAVGFVDLVGFTGRSSSMDASELADLVVRFEAAANDTVTALRGRLVKLIGDELMFAAVDPGDACRIAEALLHRFGDDDALTPRGGLAYGPVLLRGGDFFGPVVNLAARLVDQAVPGEVLLTEAAAAASHRPLEPAGRRMLKGFTDPVTVMSLTADR